MTLILRPEAEQDLHEALEWYESQQEGLGSAFMDEIEAAFERIERQPRLYKKIYGELRRALLRRFPFSIYYTAEAKEIVVIGILHQRRSPAVWRKRLA